MTELEEMMNAYRKRVYEEHDDRKAGGAFIPQKVDAALGELFGKLLGQTAHEQMEAQSVLGQFFEKRLFPNGCP
ncbi:hypothetical protein [Paracoccus sp. SM22M-07]|uniref:hypothetical protein n=1 Tax=Paracoccus sp. SM22M-07 TaxID=1520813 RepID=UPI001114DE60|nr:hypothetical protein [Paracoccus sp. SM22M-07]